MGNYCSIQQEPLVLPWVSSLLRYILTCPLVGLTGWRDSLLGLPQPVRCVSHAMCHFWAPVTALQALGAADPRSS